MHEDWTPESRWGWGHACHSSLERQRQGGWVVRRWGLSVSYRLEWKKLPQWLRLKSKTDDPQLSTSTCTMQHAKCAHTHAHLTCVKRKKEKEWTLTSSPMHTQWLNQSSCPPLNPWVHMHTWTCTHTSIHAHLHREVHMHSSTHVHTQTSAHVYTHAHEYAR